MATTALMPIDPASSPQSISRLLDIRANLLPAEIMATRNARRMRLAVIVALLLVAVLLGLWYAHAWSEKSQADQALADVSAQVTTVRQSQNRYQDVVTVKTENETVTKQLTTLMAQDLPWATLTDTIGDTGTEADVKILGITGSLTNGAGSANVLPSTKSASTVATLQIGGTAPDKKTVAKYVEDLGALPDLANPYLSAATQNEATTKGGDTTITFTLSVEVTSKALCGRFATPCTSGGK